ncbi:type IV toxin-antitoxin system AbiEi family antitoxin domain-containing protein [Deinococcus sp. SM5_A1]|uniref:type IV toxin-antitoxin system AbiEi family antitoxin domain-containing protein n=1 Tax=Deinococcus sp. SM5_A1 TaxID=3379094 RepID=UPI003859F6F8
MNDTPLTDRVLDLFARRGGYLTAQDAAGSGIPGTTLTRLLRSGVIERPQRGVYRLADTGGLESVPAELDDLLEIQLRFSYARPCLVSALHLHGLTTTRPAALQFAVPANHRRPVLDYPRLEVFYFGARFYGAGLTVQAVRGRPLTTYTAEKTLTDLLRYSSRYGRELYLEGLKNYLRQPEASVHALVAMGKDQGVWKTLGHDLEVLSHDQDH